MRVNLLQLEYNKRARVLVVHSTESVSTTVQRLHSKHCNLVPVITPQSDNPCDLASLGSQVSGLTPLQHAIILRMEWPMGHNTGPNTKGTPMAINNDIKLNLSLRSERKEHKMSRSLERICSDIRE